jgi:SSS family solute:Na+ symporter
LNNQIQQQYSSHISPTGFLSTFDWITFTFVFVLTIGAVIYGHRRKKSNATQEEKFLDHLLLGRQLTLPMFIATLVATWYGGIFGVTEIAFTSGIYNFITQGLFWYVTYIIFALFIVARIKKYEAITLPNLIEKLVGPKSAKLASIFNLINVLPIAYIISIGLFIDFLTGWGLILSSFIGTSVVIAYSLSGGFRSVIFSDLIQFFVMCSAVFFVLMFSITTFGGLGFLKENLDPNFFSLTGGHSWAETLSWGFIALSTLVDPNFYQRCFAAKDVKTARNGILLSTVIWFLFDICTTFGAMYAKAVMPEAQSGQAYLIYALHILPSGLAGLFLAGILATILSTLDSYLFLAGTTLSFDILNKRNEDAISSQNIAVVTVSLLGLFMSVFFNGNIKMVWKMLGSYSAACLLIPVLYAQFFAKKLLDNQFIIICISSVAVITLWKALQQILNLPSWDSLYIGIVCSCFLLSFFHLRNRSV